MMAALRLSRFTGVSRSWRRFLAQNEAPLPVIASSDCAPLPLPLRRCATSVMPHIHFSSSSVFNGADIRSSGLLPLPTPVSISNRRFFTRDNTALNITSIQSLLLSPVGARGFRVSPPRAAYPMVFIMVAKQAAKVVAVLTARFARNRYRAYSDESKLKFWQRVRKLWLVFVVAGVAWAGWITTYVITHIERTPYTKRLRHLSLSNSQSLELAEMELQNQMAEHMPNFLPHDSRVYRQVKSIFDNVIKGNSDIPAISDVSWKLHVVDRKDIQNAFVLATGDVFFCTGLLKMLESDDDIACILGHEMAHRVLRHDVEKASRGHLLDILFIFLASMIWLILPSDLTSIVTQLISEKVLKIILELPYSRMMEEEADLVGLDLAAKACYDVRVSSNLWSMMYLNSKLSPGSDADNPYQKFFSTHPHDKERADQLDVRIPSALQKRKTCPCPPLPHVDPRIDYRITRDIVDRLMEEELDLLRQADDADKPAIIRDLVEKKHAQQALVEKAAIAAAEEKAHELEAEKRRQQVAKEAELADLKANSAEAQPTAKSNVDKCSESGVVAPVA